MSPCNALQTAFGSPIYNSASSPWISQLPFFAGTAAIPLARPHKSDRARLALGRAACDEMTPCAGVRGLLNAPPLRGVLLPEGSGLDGLAELKLSKKAFSVCA
ncbi:MAG: hypothetical protein WCE62_16130 [Polyangiales bacterium]